VGIPERKLETFKELDRSFRLFEYPLLGFSLRFVSGPEMTKNVQPGEWLSRWTTADGKRVFGFGPYKDIAFASKEEAIAAKTELEKAVDIITEVAE
jgi:hypothetical protein